MDMFTKIMWNEDEFHFDYYKSILSDRAKMLEEDKLLTMIYFFLDNYRIKNGLFLLEKIKSEKRCNNNMLDTIKCIFLLMDKKFVEFYELYSSIDKDIELMKIYEKKVYPKSNGVFSNLDRYGIVLFLKNNFMNEYIEEFIKNTSILFDDELLLYELIHSCFYNDHFKESSYYCHLYMINDFHMYYKDVEEHIGLCWCYMPQKIVYDMNKKNYKEIYSYFSSKKFCNKIDLDVYYSQYIENLPNISE
jgi:hypothetical protein